MYNKNSKSFNITNSLSRQENKLIKKKKIINSDKGNPLKKSDKSKESKENKIYSIVSKKILFSDNPDNNNMIRKISNHEFGNDLSEQAHAKDTTINTDL